MNKELIHILPIALLIGACAQIEEPFVGKENISEGFYVYLSQPHTKTVNDGMSTLWEEGNGISLFSALAGGTEYTDNGAFTCDNVAANKFSGTLAGELDANSSYDWYAYYPYTSSVNGFYPNRSNNSTVIGSDARKETQVGNNSMAHLAGKAAFPVAGFAKNVPAADFPTITMKNVSSVVAVNVTNNLTDPIIVKNVNLVAPKPIVGRFSLDFTQDEFVLSGGDYTFVQLDITDGIEITNGESAKFYIGVAPFVAAAGEELLVYVNASTGEKQITQRLAKSLTEDMTFKSGLIKTFNVNYNQSEIVPLNVLKSDFKTLNNGTTATTYKKVEYLSYDGWKVYYGAVLPITNFATGDYVANELIAGINGDADDNGFLTSPLIAGGCKTLKFKYGIHKNNDDIKFRVEVKDASGEVKYTETIEDADPVRGQGYLFDREVNVEGTFQIVITNLAPRGKTGARADWLGVFDIEWTNPE